MSWFTFTNYRQPGPGAMSHGLAAYRLPVDSATGLGVPNGSLEVTSRPVFKNAADVPTDGLGGLQNGQFYFQALTNLDTDGVATQDPSYDLGDGE